MKLSQNNRQTAGTCPLKRVPSKDVIDSRRGRPAINKSKRHDITKSRRYDVDVTFWTSGVRLANSNPHPFYDQRTVRNKQRGHGFQRIRNRPIASETL